MKLLLPALLVAWHADAASVGEPCRGPGQADRCVSQPLGGSAEGEETSLMQAFHEVWQARRDRAEGPLRNQAEAAVEAADKEFQRYLASLSEPPAVQQEADDSASFFASTPQAALEDEQAAEFEALGKQRAAMMALTAEQVALVAHQEDLQKRVDKLSADAAAPVTQASAQSPTWASVAADVDKLIGATLSGNQLRQVNTTANTTSANSTSNTTSSDSRTGYWERIASTFGGPAGGLLTNFGHIVWDVVHAIIRAIGGFFRWIGGGIGSVHGSVTSSIGGHNFSISHHNVSFGWLPCVLFWMAVSAYIGGFVHSFPKGAGLGAAAGVLLAIFLLLFHLDGADMTSVGVYLLFMGIVGVLYKKVFSYRFPPLRWPPEPSREDFSFGLLTACSGDPDYRVCLCSFFCTAARWADTASAQNLNGYPNFWLNFFLFSALASLSTYTRGVSAVILLLWCVWNRQTIRQAYGLRSWEPSVVGQDILTYLCCAPCATMQEALQAEFIDVPPPAFPPPRKAGGAGSPDGGHDAFLSGGAEAPHGASVETVPQTDGSGAGGRALMGSR